MFFETLSVTSSYPDSQSSSVYSLNTETSESLFDRARFGPFLDSRYSKIWDLSTVDLYSDSISTFTSSESLFVSAEKNTRAQAGNEKLRTAEAVPIKYVHRTEMEGFNTTLFRWRKVWAPQLLIGRMKAQMVGFPVRLKRFSPDTSEGTLRFFDGDSSANARETTRNVRIARRERSSSMRRCLHRTRRSIRQIKMRNIESLDDWAALM